MAGHIDHLIGYHRVRLLIMQVVDLLGEHVVKELVVLQILPPEIVRITLYQGPRLQQGVLWSNRNQTFQGLEANQLHNEPEPEIPEVMAIDQIHQIESQVDQSHDEKVLNQFPHIDGDFVGGRVEGLDVHIV